MDKIITVKYPLEKLYVEPTGFMPAYNCNICGSYNKFTRGCTACDAERQQDMQLFFDKVYDNGQDDMDYVSDLDPENY